MHRSSVPAAPPSTRRRKIYAVLAGGLVLGVGAAVTLAAWNDSEFADGDFAAGTFVFQGSSDGSAFTDHASEAGAASLSFSTGFDSLSPDSEVYAPFAVRLDASSSSAADLTTVGPTAAGDLAGSLSFDSVSTSAFGCDASAFAAGTAVPTSLQPGDTVNLCLRVTAGALTDAQQGDAATVVWQWNAVSQ